MNNALINPLVLMYDYNKVLLGEQIAEVSTTPFPVALPLYWIECANEITAEEWYFNTETESCELIPLPPSSAISLYEQKIQFIRSERDSRLAASDWTQLADVIAAHDSAWLGAWNDYRQTLRDLLACITEANVDSVVYPVPPQ